MTASDIIDRLAEHRAAQGLTLRKLAEHLGYGHSTIEQWETGRRQPNLQRLVDWCEALGVDLEIRQNRS